MKTPKNNKPVVTPEDKEDLPIVEFVGLVKLPKGHVAVAGKLQGDKVIETETITDEPSSKAHALERLKIEVVRRFQRVS